MGGPRNKKLQEYIFRFHVFIYIDIYLYLCIIDWLIDWSIDWMRKKLEIDGFFKVHNTQGHEKNVNTQTK